MRARTPWIVTLVLAAGCGQPSGDGKLTEREVRAVRPAAPAIPDADPALRFRGESARPHAEEPAAGYELADLFLYDLPEGWERLESNQMRIVNVRPAGDPRAECYLMTLPAMGGGIADNVNRWRAQMGLPEISAEEVEDLPRRGLLREGIEGVYVDLEGTFTGMGGPEREDWRMLGLIVPIRELHQTLFLKLTGPADVVAGEVDAFEEFCDSLRANPQTVRGMDPEHPPPPPPAPAEGGAPHDLAWTAPEGWTDQGPRTMRVVSYQVAPGTECYLALARGDALANYNRWRGQVGAPPLDADGLAALDTVEVLGEPCPLLEVTGDFRGMGGGEEPDTGLLGTMRALGDEALFVKMVGPADEVAAARGEFLAFCRSIEQDR